MGKEPLILSGQALLGEELALSSVDIVIEAGVISAIEDNPRAPADWICPAFFNAHTHLGDTIAMDCGVRGDLAALVTPPDGLKHRLLAAASRADLIAGMRGSIRGMSAGGPQAVQISAKVAGTVSPHCRTPVAGWISAR